MNPVPMSVSLLDRPKLARPDASDRDRRQGIDLPLIRPWLARVPGLGDEADDLARDGFVVVVRERFRFERRREGSFRVATAPGPTENAVLQAKSRTLKNLRPEAGDPCQ
jgi:hypothetical protein